MEYDSIEVPAARVDRTSGIFNPGDASDRFLEYNLDEVLTHANRIIANFNFTATADAGSTGVPLIWDGDLVRRTDLERMRAGWPLRRVSVCRHRL